MKQTEKSKKERKQREEFLPSKRLHKWLRHFLADLCRKRKKKKKKQKIMSKSKLTNTEKKEEKEEKRTSTRVLEFY
jgi:hypothetical protein